MRSPVALIGSVLSLAGVLVAATPVAGQPPVYVRVPRGGGYIYVPLDPSGQPVGLPGAEPPPPGATAPSSGRVPGAPGVPGAPDAPLPGTGFLIVEIEPAGASLYVDGRRVGTTEVSDGQGRWVALTPGEHRVDIVHPGYAPLVAAVVIVPGQTSVLRSRLAREVSGSPIGSGYFVVPAP